MAKRKSISTKVWRPLLAQSGNRCAFPGCTHPIIDESHNLVAQLCHIEAALPDGQRYNPDQADEERNGYSNLLFLCYRHHIKTNNVDKYSVQRLKDIKYQHESQFAEKPFEVDLSIVYLLKKEMEAYWNEVENIHSNCHVFDELKISVDSKALFKQLFTDARELLSGIDEMCSLMNANDRKRGEVYNWELYSLGIPNRTKHLFLIIVQSEIKYLEEYLVLNSHDLASRQRLEDLKQEFKLLAQKAIHID